MIKLKKFVKIIKDYILVKENPKTNPYNRELRLINIYFLILIHSTFEWMKLFLLLHWTIYGSRINMFLKRIFVS